MEKQFVATITWLMRNFAGLDNQVTELQGEIVPQA